MNAIEAAEKILWMVTKTSLSDIQEARKKIATAESTYGILWGLRDINKSGIDLDFYLMKDQVLKLMEEIHEHELFPLVCALALKVEKEKNDPPWKPDKPQIKTVAESIKEHKKEEVKKCDSKR